MDSTPSIPQTVQDIMNAVYTNVDDDPTAALTQDDEYTARLNLINMGILKWASQDVLWKELWTLYTFSEAVGSSLTYSITATNFLQPGSLLYLTNVNGQTSFVDVIRPEQAIKYVNNPGRQAVWFSGNPAVGWTMNLCWQPVEGDNTYGSTMSFYYYASPNRVASTTDVPQMSDPNYLIWYVTGQKQLFNNRTDMASIAMAEAQECMDNMRIRNEMTANYQDNAIEDVELFRWNDSMGF